MQFLYPNFLWALLLLALPILIHLFYFKRFKKVYFSNVRLLHEIKEQTSSRNRLKHLLILLSRLLAIACLVFAFAQPYFSKDTLQKQGTAGVSIYIDNTFSMDAEANGESLLQIAKKKAFEIAQAYSETDKIQILTADFEGQHQRFLPKEEVKEVIDQIKPTAQVQNLSSIIKRQRQAFNTDAFDQEYIYILSDFQKSITDDIQVDTSQFVEFIPIQSNVRSNISVDSVYFESGVALLNQANKIHIVLSNHSEDEATGVRVQLELDNQTSPVDNIDLGAKQTKTITTNITPKTKGWHEAKIKINDFPVVFDNEHQFAFYVNENVRILAINQGRPNSNLNAVFKNLGYFNLINQSIAQIQYNQFNSMDLIVLNDINQLSSGLQTELIDYISKGGKVLIFPSKSINTQSYNSLLKRVQAPSISGSSDTELNVNTINQDEFVFSDVFNERQSSNIKLPITQFNYLLKQFQNNTSEVLLKYRNNDPFLIKKEVDEGFLYLCTAPLDQKYSDLTNNAEIFVPMLYKMALANGKGAKIAYTIGTDRLVKINHSNEEKEVYTLQGPIEFIPGILNTKSGKFMDVSEQLNVAGFYKYVSMNQLNDIFAFNYNRKESDLNYYSTKELSTTYPNVRTIDKSELKSNLTQRIKDNAYKYWKVFLIGALLFLFIETLLIRFLK